MIKKMGKNNRKFLLETGQKFGRLEVKKHAGKNYRHENLWLVKCDCGNEKILPTGDLTNRNVRSCGCLRIDICKSKRIDLSGKRFGKLVANKLSNKKRKNGTILWECLCDCGNYVYADITSLKSGNSTSCGCSRQKLPHGYPEFNRVMRSYKRKAKKENRKWLLTKEIARELFESNCYYCDVEPSNISKYHNEKGNFTYNGIDRLNSSGDYELSNVVPCCIKCNRAKHIMGEIEFLEHIERIYNFRIKRKCNKDLPQPYQHLL